MSGFDELMECVSGGGEEGERMSVVSDAQRFDLRMKRVREHLGLEQGEFARRFRLDPETVARLECGMARSDPFMNLVLAMIEHYPTEVAIVAERLNQDVGDLANYPDPRLHGSMQ